ncbi:MAG: cytidylate kinase-like family protein [Alistipes sp.]|nr:cytidylate kinase-like family protein [Alistipes senegalensis]MCM1249659.1 cytidylate kinase-like family protein [Alistipes sp.]
MENRFVINIGRQIGSGGKSVGEALARRLGVKLYDKELINLAAKESGLCPEIFEEADERQAHNRLATLLGYLRAPFFGGDGAAGSVLSGDALFKIQSDVIRDIAGRESALFVGRCADYILRDHPRRLGVFITADEEDRAARICARTGCSEAEARQTMERGDARRAAYYDYYSLRRWGAAASYDLCVNTSVLGIEGTADLILRFAARKLDLNLQP